MIVASCHYVIVAHDQVQVFTVLARKDALQGQIGFRKSRIVVTVLVEPRNGCNLFNIENQFLYRRTVRCRMASVIEFEQCAVQRANMRP